MIVLDFSVTIALSLFCIIAFTGINSETLKCILKMVQVKFSSRASMHLPTELMICKTLP